MNAPFRCLAIATLSIAALLPGANQSSGAKESRATPEALDAWRSYRFGLFVHWGPSSGCALPQSHSHARKSALNPSGSVPPEVYDQFYREFNPVGYDPDSWLKLAHEAGMRYAVFVTKHHDGFCMFNTSATAYNVMNSPYARDVAGLFADACRRQGLALGWQISPKDWKHPDFNTERQDVYNTYYERLVKDLATNYGPLSVMWFDGIEPAGPEKWKDTPVHVAAMLHQTNPQIVLGNHGGATPDFLSFEEMPGPFDREQAWEMTEAINPSGWVFNRPMPTYPFRKLLRNMVYTVSRDGNYLLDVGPMPDGQLYPPDAARLNDFADWMKVNAEGVHGTRGGPYRDGEWGGATSKGRNVYLFISDAVSADLELQKLPAKILNAVRLDGQPLTWSGKGKHLSLHFPARTATNRPVFLCVKLTLDRDALRVPLTDAQVNLATASKITASSIRDGDANKWGPALLFDNCGDTGWDSNRAEHESWLQFDLKKVRSIGSLSMAQMNQHDGWSGVFNYHWRARESAESPWKTVSEGAGLLGGEPIISITPTRAKYLELRLTKRRNGPVQLGELRVLPPLLP